MVFGKASGGQRETAAGDPFHRDFSGLQLDRNLHLNPIFCSTQKLQIHSNSIKMFIII